MKFCKDSQCRRSGQRLSLSEFPRDQRSDDGRYIYCSECSRRKSRELRARRGAQERRKRDLGIDRIQMVLSDEMAFTKVYDAVNSGCRTREQIRKETKLDYDSIGEALVELVFDCKAIRIQDRELHLTT